MNDKIWMITGASQGLGLSLARTLLAKGFKVAAASRSIDDLLLKMGKQTAAFLPVQMDITEEESVLHAVRQVVEQFGRIDVVVNNAGYGQTGTIEELSNAEVEESFRVNVFGTLHVIRHVMPFFRENRSGHFFNLSSIGGYTGGYAGWGIYCATKFAVAGLTEALLAETKALGISATVVYPGAFRTNFLNGGSLKGPSHLIDEYGDARASRHYYENELNGKQQGDPEKFAEAIIKIAQEANPPLHLFLGKDAWNASFKKMELVKSDLQQWKDLSCSTSFEGL